MPVKAISRVVVERDGRAGRGEPASPAPAKAEEEGAR
jgi:hypothetical protein